MTSSTTARRSPSRIRFSFGGGPVPDDWVRFSRGREGSYQRLVFGPPDDHEAFLDDITLSLGASEQPLVGGYQLLRELEIGPLMRSGDTDPIDESEWRLLEPARGTIACDDAESCKAVRDLLARYEAAHAGRKAPRTMPEPAP